MANQWYNLGLQAIGTAGVNLTSDTLRVSLVTSGYSPNISTDQYYSIIASGNIVAAGVQLTSVTLTGAGALGAANTTWTSVSGSQAAYIILYKDTGTASTSPLLGKIDTATGLPVTPNGGNIVAAWASGVIATMYQGLAEEERDSLTLAQRLARLWDLVRGPGGLLIPECPRIVLG